MPPHRDGLAEEIDDSNKAAHQESQSPEQMAAAISEFLTDHPEASVLEDGKVAFELANAKHSLSTEHARCMLHLWSGERNLVRTITAAVRRNGSLRLSTQRFGHSQTKLLELRAEPQRRSPARREPTRKHYLRVLERVLAREFPDWKSETFRAAMDLERSFGPAYARGMLVRGNEAWAVIGVGASESQATIDGVLTLGILWLHHCRERGDGRRVHKGLRIILPRGAGMLTLARLPWLNTGAAQWELYELDEGTEELVQRDPADQGNVRTRLIHHPDETAARERFADAIRQVMELVPSGEQDRVQQRLRSTSELAFLLYGLEFARARISLAPGSFAQTLEITAGSGAAQTVLNASTHDDIRELFADLFRRRHGRAVAAGRTLKPTPPGRSIGAFTGRPAHARVALNGEGSSLSRLEMRDRALAAQGDPLYRAAPERWLESVLRDNLAPLTRSLARVTESTLAPQRDRFANEPDPDTRGNRADVDSEPCWNSSFGRNAGDRIIPRFDPRYVYTQVPAIAGASDRGMLDLLGVTADGRLAVIELKASDDLQMVLQGLDYWIRVRHHHTQVADPATGLPGNLNDLQRHGYFREVNLSPLPPRLYLVAPALHIHPATERVLRYLSPRVEWTLIALDERWRQEVRVVWRKSGGRAV